MSKALVSIQNLSKVYITGDIETRALNGLSLEIREKTFLSVEGPSGCGKSTLLSILGLLDTPTSGAYQLAGHQVASLTFDQRAKARNEHIGFIFQAFHLIEDLTVRENVALPLTYAGTKKKQALAQAEDILERVGLSGRSGHRPAQLSGGQQQRVAIARALVNKPKLILADEPTGNLDTENGNAIMDLLTDLNRSGATICMVTHNPEHANRAGMKIRMQDGAIRTH